MNKKIISEIYKELTGRNTKNTNCRNCWDDYLIEIYTIMAKKKKKGEDLTEINDRLNLATAKEISKQTGGYQLHPCYSIKVGGRTYTDKNLTDDVAKMYIENGGKKHVFKVIPKEIVTQKIKPVESVEVLPEIIPEENQEISENLD